MANELPSWNRRKLEIPPGARFLRVGFLWTLFLWIKNHTIFLAGLPIWKSCLLYVKKGAVKKRIAIQRIFTHKKHRACPGKTDTLFLYVRAKNVLIFNDSVIARPSGRGDLLVKYANLKRSTRRLPRRFAARNDGVDDGWHLYPRKCIASICIRVSLQPLFSVIRYIHVGLHCPK